MLTPSTPNDLDFFMIAKVIQRVSKSIALTLNEHVKTRGSSAGVGPGGGGGGMLAAVTLPIDA